MISKEKLGTYDAIKRNIEQQAVEQYKKGLLEWLNQEQFENNASRIRAIKKGVREFLIVSGARIDFCNEITEKIQSSDLDKAVE